MCKLNFGQIKKNCAALPLGGAIRFKKHKNSYNYASVSPIELKIVCSIFVQYAISVYEEIGVSQKTWPPSAN